MTLQIALALAVAPDKRTHKLCPRPSGCGRWLPRTEEYWYISKGIRRAVRICAYCRDCKKAVKAARIASGVEAVQQRIRYARRGVENVCRKHPKRPATAPGGLCLDCFWGQLAKRHLGSNVRRHDLASLFAQQDEKCALTGRRMRIAPGSVTWDSLSVDHITPRARGGADEIQNLRLVCWLANSVKGIGTDEEFRAAWSDLGAAMMELMMRGLDMHDAEREASNDAVDLVAAVRERQWLGAETVKKEEAA